MSKATFNPTRFNKSQNEPFSSILEKRVSRRDVLKGGSAMAALTMFASFSLVGCNDSDDSNAEEPQPQLRLGFNSIAGSKTDAVVIPEGYSAQLLIPWGEPINALGNAWRNDGTNTATDQANAIGMNHDGMRYYPLNGSSTDGVLCINHEYINRSHLHFDGVEEGSAEYVRKEINAHGVSVVRVQLNGDTWQMVQDDPLNRRYTGATTMEISGPLRGSAHLVTPFSPTGTQTRGTLNNCGNGFTPWGTYLTCEENWPGYFAVDSEAVATANQIRLGIPVAGSGGDRYGWYRPAGDASETLGEFTRFNVSNRAGSSALEDYRNEANGFGYIVEIDPFDASANAVKRTAMGRFRHECCVYARLEAGQPLTFYSGHDGRFEYLYRYVSNASWDPADAERTDRLAVGNKYLDSGTLSVARFDADGTGTWLPLTLDSATTDGGTLRDLFDSEDALFLNSPGAADAVGATPMDRPEWISVDPGTGSVYMTLTNNTRRTDSTNPANPRLNNAFGHIIRWDEIAGTETFNWDIFVFGSPSDGDSTVNLSGLEDLNQFASPDGLVFDDRGIMWIQTDNGADEVEEYTNDQMLAVIPSQLVDADGNQQVISSSNQAELKRFFVGPNGCEVTGLTFTPDNKTFFANIQHPGNWPFEGEGGDATTVTPAGTTVRARSATVVFRKLDGGDIGV